MLLESDAPRDADTTGKPSRPQRPRSALEAELNNALERLDHQVQDTKDYLATLDKQMPRNNKRRRASDRKPDR